MLIQVGISVRKQRTGFEKRLQMEILYPIMNEENLLHMRGMKQGNKKVTIHHKDLTIRRIQNTIITLGIF